MIQIAVSDVEAQAICESATPVVVVDPQGKPLGQITPVDPQIAAQPGIPAERLAEIKRRMANDDGSRYTLSEIMERVRALAPE
jgi:hypothetical protein